jgi:hydrogenase nickel incorporation protein HypA/HybF
MHELSVVEGMMHIIGRKARENGLDRIVAVRLKVGELRGFDSRQLALCFEMLSEASVAAGARLSIDKVPPRCRCRTCSQIWAVVRFCFQCPSCGGSDAEIVAGREFYIESLEGQRLPERDGGQSPGESRLAGPAVRGDN